MCAGMTDEAAEENMTLQIPNNYQPWIDARKKYRLSHAQIQMARELGMNPKKFGSLANSDQERWKAPLGEFIERLYRKRFGRKAPDPVRSIEEMIEAERLKKEQRRARKLAQAAEAADDSSAG